MELHPIQSFKEASAQKKAAIVGGAVAATAAVATGAAYLAGKGLPADKFEASQLKENGQPKFLAAVKAGFQAAIDKVKGFFHKEKPVVEEKEVEAAADAAGDKTAAEAVDAADAAQA